MASGQSQAPIDSGVPGGFGENGQQNYPGHEAYYEQADERGPSRVFAKEELLEVGESHVITEGVCNARRNEMTRSQEKVRRIHAEDGRITELEAGDQNGGLQRHSLAQVLDHVVEVSDAEEERRYQDGT